MSRHRVIVLSSHNRLRYEVTYFYGKPHTVIIIIYDERMQNSDIISISFDIKAHHHTVFNILIVYQASLTYYY